MKNAKSWLVWGAVVVGTIAAGALIFMYMLNSAVEETNDTEQALANNVPPTIAYRKIAENFNTPVDIAATSDPSDSRLFIVEKRGVIKVVNQDGEIVSEPFLDIERNVFNEGESGLLSLVFHPDYQTNGRFFINYVRPAGEGEDKPHSVVAEYSVSKADPNRADATSFKEILRQRQPFTNHNGGDMAFGQDGHLYIAFGDGGGTGDPENNAQKLNTWLGKILRIDVDGETPYESPIDNPFVSRESAKSEIWSYGWRNPWRFSFDRQTGEMYIGDVGQNTYEEINREPANTSGLNYGWRCYEGDQKYMFDEPCSDSVAYTTPYLQYGHQGDSCTGSVTGGFVYRGQQFPKLDGYYFYADYCTNRLFVADTTRFVSPFEKDVGAIVITSFGENSTGELFFTDAATGDIYQLISE